MFLKANNAFFSKIANDLKTVTFCFCLDLLESKTTIETFKIKIFLGLSKFSRKFKINQNQNILEQNMFLWFLFRTSEFMEIKNYS